VYKDIKENSLYKKVEYFELESIWAALYAYYRFRKNKKGDIIVSKATTEFAKSLDDYFKVGKKLSGSRIYEVVQYKNGDVSQTFKSIMENLGYTKYTEELRKVFKSFKDTTRFSTKVASVGKSIVSTTGSLLKEEFTNEISFKDAGKGLWKGITSEKGLIGSVKEGLTNFKSATKFGKFLKGATVVGAALDVVDTFLNISDNEKRKKLVVYINPPYAEAGNTRQRTGTGENKAGTAIENRTYQKYKGIIERNINLCLYVKTSLFIFDIKPPKNIF